MVDKLKANPQKQEERQRTASPAGSKDPVVPAAAIDRQPRTVLVAAHGWPTDAAPVAKRRSRR